MMSFIRLIFESFRFAWSALKMNLLRTVLSLLGVTVGIFSIIGVLTLVYSLEKSLRDSFEFLGANVMYIQKWPWSFGGEDYPWWKYMQRPQASYEEFKFIQSNMVEGVGISIFADKGGLTVKNGSNSISGMNLSGITFGHSEIYDMPIAEGRYFTMIEVESGRNVALIGSNVAEALFPGRPAAGGSVKIRGLNFNVVGVLKEQGENFIGIPTGDDFCFIPYRCFRKMYATNRTGGIESTVAVKGRDDDNDLKRLEGELTGLMRRKRGLRPLEESDFALNRSELVSDQLSILFGQLSFIGFLIGLFAMLVGGFGIANIMFVSVKERTSIIGIQKSLGAKNYFVLWQFLFEAIFLSIIGGLAGLFLVYLTTFIPLGPFQIVMSLKNILLGLIIAALAGTISGIIPAIIAARMDPVAAIRS